MTNGTENKSDKTMTARRRQTLLLSILLISALGSAALLNRWLETNRPPLDSRSEEEKLYVTGKTARRMSLAFNGLIADWYWMRALQYVGRKIIAQGDKFQFTDLGSLDLKLLYPLLDAATTLDPQFIPVYEYGGVVLPAINDELAIKLLNKGIDNNPSEWRLFHHLGYIYWQRKDYKAASETYAKGAKLALAPSWMQAMSARMLAEEGSNGGSTDTAREMYTRIYEQSDSADIRKMAELRLMQLDSLDERKVIRAILNDYQARHGRCVSGWRDVAPALRAARLLVNDADAPVDPADVPFLVTKDGCDVDADPGSPVPYK